MTMMHTEEFKQANTSFLAKILHAKRTMIQDGQSDQGINNLEERKKNHQIE